jgi:hypothetical protein
MAPVNLKFVLDTAPSNSTPENDRLLWQPCTRSLRKIKRDRKRGRHGIFYMVPTRQPTCQPALALTLFLHKRSRRFLRFCVENAPTRTHPCLHLVASVNRKHRCHVVYWMAERLAPLPATQLGGPGLIPGLGQTYY